LGRAERRPRGSRDRSLNRPATTALLLLCALSITLVSETALGLPNTHPGAVSTWDVRASSVVLGLGRLVSGESDYTNLSYSANFSSTSGLLSAQFGIHYLGYRRDPEAPLARGIAAGGVALLTFPLGDRFESGIPGQSFCLYAGGVPTALIGKQRNLISIPVVLGLGLPYSPWSSLTLTPWAELSPGLNFDTRIQAVSTDAAVDAALDGTLTQEEVEALVDQGIEIQSATKVGKRAGLALSLHLAESLDVDVNLLLGAGGGGAAAVTSALVFRWDDQVPGVLSQDQRLAREGCGAVEARFRSCPAARQYVVRDPAAVPRAAPAQPRTTIVAPPQAAPGAGPAKPARAGDTAPSTSTDEKRKRPDASRPATEAGPVAPPSVHDLPPLRAAPPN
jgi:hypothetical protein